MHPPATADGFHRDQRSHVLALRAGRLKPWLPLLMFTTLQEPGASVQLRDQGRSTEGTTRFRHADSRARTGHAFSGGSRFAVIAIPDTKRAGSGWDQALRRKQVFSTRPLILSE